MPLIEYNYPLSWLDKQLYRYKIIPEARKALLQRQKAYGWMDSKPNWGAGRVDPFNGPKFGYLGLPIDDTIGNTDLPPVWNQGQHEGFAIHLDGLQTSLTELIISSALGDGVPPDSINTEDLQRVEDYIRQVQPPLYAFALDRQLADRGKKLFDSNCASCHAFGGEKTGTVIPIDEVGTDRNRLDMWTQEAANAYNNFAKDYSFDFNNFRKTNGYVAVSLEGLWLRAPYLHNGSVPSLQDLLNVPEQRPKLFYSGYDVYNAEKVGFVTEGSEAQRYGFRYDISVAGNSNQGHLYGTDLSADEKQALLEFLKTL